MPPSPQIVTASGYHSTEASSWHFSWLKAGAEFQLTARVFKNISYVLIEARKAYMTQQSVTVVNFTTMTTPTQRCKKRAWTCLSRSRDSVNIPPVFRQSEVSFQLIQRVIAISVGTVVSGTWACAPLIG